MSATRNEPISMIDGIPRRILSSSEWNAARQAITAKEKAHMRAGDRLAAERRAMPWTRIDGAFSFEGPEGQLDLPSLFEDRKQLILYHFMYGPAVDGWPDAACVGCSMFADQVSRLEHLHARGVTFAFVSAAPRNLFEAYRKRLDWKVPWFSCTEEFNRTCGISKESGHSFGLSVFYRNGENVYRTHFVGHRGVEAFGTVWSFLDITPFGRQEIWQDAPEGTPQSKPYAWWRRHDEYDPRASGCECQCSQ